MTITDEVVEVAAKAIVSADYVRNPRTMATSISFARDDARAALEAVAPAIRKAALEEAEARICAALAAQRDYWDSLMHGYRDTGMKEAASAANQRRAAFNHAVSIVAIRNLADKEGT